MRAVLRTQRYAVRTEKAYCDWVRRYVKFHGMKSRADLAEGTRKAEAFLTHLAVSGEVSPSTQNQALNALLFLYDRVLEQPLTERINAVRSVRSPRVPEVLSPEEARRVIALVSGVPQLVVKLIYGSGLRLLEVLRLRVKDIDFKLLSVTVRGGKGFRDRVTPRFAEFQIADFRLQIADGEWGCGCRRRWRGSMSPRRRSGRGNGCFPVGH
jgi:site-specific recombinase XerD